MTNLFEDNGAIFSDCRKYRYALYRIWDKSKPLIMFIGLNPSTANESENDPTIRRVIKFASDWDFGGVYMMNLFPLVSTDPKALLGFYSTPDHEFGLQQNNVWLKEIHARCKDVIFAWGAFPEAEARAKEVAKMFPGAKALILNKDGSPRHPLYVPGNTVPVNFV